MSLRDRITDVREMTGRELLKHPRNHRRHGQQQRAALAGVLSEIGKAGVLYAWYSERNGGALTVYDGHLRIEDYPDETWHVAITDLTDAEADYMLGVHDHLSSLADIDPEALDALLRDLKTTSAAVSDMLAAWADEEGIGEDQTDGEAEPRAEILAGATLADLGPSEEEMAVLQGRRIIVEFSGGKDSSAAAVWAKHYLPDAPMELMFCDMGADFYGFPLFLQEFAAWIGGALTVVRSPENMFDVFLAKGEWPHFRHPYCHDVLHGALDGYLLTLPADEIVILRGGRAQEKAAASTVRPDRWMVLDRKPDYRYFQPLYFADKDSGERISAEAGAPVWEGYGTGLCRTACRICPGQRPRAYAAMRARHPGVWAELLALEGAFGLGAWQGRDGSTPLSFTALADKAEAAAVRDETRKQAKEAKVESKAPRKRKPRGGTKGKGK